MAKSVDGSPCNGWCRLSNGSCTGCLRTLNEIVRWAAFSDKEKRKVLQEIERRKKQK